MICGQQALQALVLLQLHIEQDSKDCKSARCRRSTRRMGQAFGGIPAGTQ